MSDKRKMPAGRMDPDLSQPVNPEQLLKNSQAAAGADEAKNWHQVLDERELAAVKLASSYAEMGHPGLPGHLYLVLIHKLSVILDTLDPAFELEFEPDG